MNVSAVIFDGHAGMWATVIGEGSLNLTAERRAAQNVSHQASFGSARQTHFVKPRRRYTSELPRLATPLQDTKTSPDTYRVRLANWTDANASAKTTRAMAIIETCNRRSGLLKSEMTQKYLAMVGRPKE